MCKAVNICVSHMTARVAKDMVIYRNELRVILPLRLQIDALFGIVRYRCIAPFNCAYKSRGLTTEATRRRHVANYRKVLSCSLRCCARTTFRNRDSGQSPYYGDSVRRVLIVTQYSNSLLLGHCVVLIPIHSAAFCKHSELLATLPGMYSSYSDSTFYVLVRALLRKHAEVAHLRVLRSKYSKSCSVRCNAIDSNASK